MYVITGFNSSLFFTRQVAAEIAAPLSQAKKVTMVSSGKGDVGAAKLTGEVLQVMEDLPKVVQGMTGVDISKVTAFACNQHQMFSFRCSGLRTESYM